MPPRQLPMFLSVLGCLSAACDTSKPTSTGPAEVEEHDALVDALDCAGLAEPMTLERMEDAWAAMYPVFNRALHPYMDDVQLATADALAGRSACATTVEDGDTSTARGSCAEVDGLAFEGAMTVTRSADVYDSTWEDLSTMNDGVVIMGDGTYRYEERSADGAAIAIQADRSWTAEGDEDVDGSYNMHVEGAVGVPGEVLAGWVVAGGSFKVPTGELCFAMTCASDAWVVVGGRTSEPDASTECRFLFQGDRLWEQTYGLTAEGRHCTTVSADGEVVEDTCD